MSYRRLWIAGLLVLGTACGSKDAKKDGTPSVNVGGMQAAAGAASNAGTGGRANVAGAGASGAGGSKPASTGGSVATGTGGSDAAPTDCKQGLTVVGMVYSPGGTVLPNPCLPFHPTTNNPYAVRCIDAWSWYKTKFPGDQYCILPPPPDQGVQVGVHPQGKQWFAQVSKGDMSGYDNPTNEWIMQDGEEEQFNYHTSADNQTAENYYRGYARMRGGSHHMINSTAPLGTMQETWGPGAPDGLTMGTAVPGAQRPDENTPKTLEKPAEDKGLYTKFPANPGVTFNMHHFNATGGPILKEAWVNLWWESDATIEVHGILGLELSQVATMAIPPGTITDLHYSWTIQQPVRLITAYGHRHAWTTNFSSWIEAPGKQPEILYQSFQWLDEPTYRYDSLAKNPVPAPDKHTDGATSGVRTLNVGEKLHFNCHIEYTDARAVHENAPKTPEENGTLHFANEAFTAEMCILFGSTSGGSSLPTPMKDASPLPSFATIP